MENETDFKTLLTALKERDQLIATLQKVAVVQGQLIDDLTARMNAAETNYQALVDILQKRIGKISIDTSPFGLGSN